MGDRDYGSRIFVNHMYLGPDTDTFPSLNMERGVGFS